MEKRKRICRFCLEKCDKNFKAIGKSTHDILNILLVTVNPAISDEPVMCENCSKILQKSFVFKKICLSIQDNTDVFDSAENEGHTVCKFCMNQLKDHSFTILDIEDVSEKTILEKYFPELKQDLSASKKPKICEICNESLVTFLSFITTFSIVEEKIREYCETKGVDNTNSVKLNDVLQFISENILKENNNKLEVFEVEDVISVKSENEKVKIEEETCILCLENRENFRAIDEDTKDILDIILPKIDFTGGQELCENCEDMLMKCFDFKTVCLNNHSFMVSFFNNEEDVKLDLKDVYLSKNVTCTDVPKDQDVCAFCLSLVDNCSAISLVVEEGDVMLERMIEECLPELDLRIIKRPVMCASCHGSLEDCFHFVMKCLIVREQNNKHCETPDVNSESQIELSSSIQFTTREIKREVDGNSSNKIEVEDHFYEDSMNLDDREIGDRRNTVKLEQMFLDDSEDSNKDIESKCEGFMEINDQEVKDEQKFTPKNVLDNTEESSGLGSFKIEDTVCREKEAALKEENSVGMEDQEFLLNEEIDIKTDEHDFNGCEDSIVLPQSGGTRGSHRREKCSMLNFEKDQSKSDITHALTKKQISKIKMCQRELSSFQTKHKKSLVNDNLMLEDFKKRPSEVTKYNCDSCSFQARNKYYLKTHLLVHKDPSEVTMYKCDFCSYQTKIKFYLKRHLLKHKDPSEVFKCNFCSFQTNDKRCLVVHFLKHKNPSEVTMYKCDSCSFQTKFKSALKQHVLRHKDPSEVTMYKCDFCSLQTKFKSCLKRHLLTHKDLSEVTVYKCDICSLQTKHKKCLKSHLLTHKKPSEVTMYKCDFCSFQTKFKNYLKRHVLMMHKSPSEVTMHKCYLCSFQTKIKGYLKRHLLTHKDPSEVTVYKCNICSLQTKTKTCLEYHLLTHKDLSKVTMYKCDLCSYQTKHKRWLKNHLLIHKDSSEVTMYKCDFCSYQAKFKNYLKRHLLRVHKDPSEATVNKC